MSETPVPVRKGAAASPHHATRRSGTDAKISRAVLDICRTTGIHAVTIEAVAALSGVAKTTIYRRYADRFELLAGVADGLAPHDPQPPVLTKAGLNTLLRHLQRAFEERVGLARVGNMLASDDDFIRQWREKVVAPQMAHLEAYFAAGVASGVFAADLDLQTLVELVVGGMVMADAMRGRVPEDWTLTMTDLVWPLIRAEA